MTFLKVNRGRSLVWVLLMGCAFAQVPTFRAQSNVVTVPALVKDARGLIVYGLKASDFIIEDDGTIQKARLDEAVESEPVSLGGATGGSPRIP